jgi:very-short-patch-repair endonuclease
MTGGPGIGFFDQHQTCHAPHPRPLSRRERGEIHSPTSPNIIMSGNHSPRSRARRLRKDQTPAESRLWFELRNRRFVGHKFRRQHPLGPYVADFYCHEAALIIELDGESHLGRETYDRQRQDWLEAQGFKVLRFYNNDIPANLDEMLECIFRECRSRTAPKPTSPESTSLPPSPSGRGPG